ncbi:hypothetical protein J6590_020708 [Homalodisca vitripennis]|nr:hypothetical protein J6590_020708 [Homalodisca vitripennis]
MRASTRTSSRQCTETPHTFNNKRFSLGPKNLRGASCNWSVHTGGKLYTRLAVVSGVVRPSLQNWVNPKVPISFPPFSSNQTQTSKLSLCVVHDYCKFMNYNPSQREACKNSKIRDLLRERNQPPHDKSNA